MIVSPAAPQYARSAIGRLPGVSCRERHERDVQEGARQENAMKFMFMIYHDEKVLDAMPETEMQALVDSAIEYAEEIRQSGHYIASDALQRTGTARTIRIRAGNVSTTVGPFVETKEQLGG